MPESIKRNPEYLIPGKREWIRVRITDRGIEEIPEECNPKVNPLLLAHFGSHIISVDRTSLGIERADATRELYMRAMQKARDIEADFFAGSLDVNLSSGTKTMRALGVFNFYLANFPLPNQ